MTITIPDWLWWAGAGLLALAGALVGFLTLQRRRPPTLDPYVPSELLEATMAAEAGAVEVAQAEHAERVAELESVVALPDPDTRTQAIAGLLEAWSP